MWKFFCSILTAAPGVIVPGVFAIREHDENKYKCQLLLAICVEMSILLGWEYFTVAGRFCILYSLLSAMLMAAVFMDIIWQEIYDFIWLVSIPVGCAILFAGRSINIEVALSLVLFMVVQETVMANVYGRADCHAFCSCAIILASFGGALEYYVALMGIAWSMLFIDQLIKKNVLKTLKLKRPVPMLPYIAISMVLVTGGFRLI